jgi:hypothetical protein
MTEPTDTWTAFDAYREMKVVAEGKILVVRPSDAATIVPLFCAFCRFPMKTADDSIAYRKAGCCDKCLLFCRGRKEEMPPEQWEEYLQDRQNCAKPLIIIK